jgi:Cdc6-like AAA superfamily ATPase
MASGYDIYEIKIPGQKKAVDEPRLDELKAPLPKPKSGHSFRMMLIGPSGSGKSNFFTNLIMRGDMYGAKKGVEGVFDHIYIFCPTFYRDQTLSKLTLPGTNGQTFINPDDVFTFATAKEIGEKIAEINGQLEKEIAEHDNPDQPPPKTLMVFDDLNNEISKAPFIINLFTKGRKNEVSVIIMTNKYKVFDPQIRANATHYGVFRVTTEQELKSIAQDVIGYEDKAVTALEYMVRQSKEDHPFIFIDKTARPDDVFWYKLNKRMVIGD